MGQPAGANGELRFPPSDAPGARAAIRKEELKAREWRDKAILADRQHHRYDEAWFAAHPDRLGQPPNGRRGRRSTSRR
jgi:hypothetical protein